MRVRRRSGYRHLFIARDIVLNDERHAVWFTRRDNGVLFILTSNRNVTSQLKLFTFLRGMGERRSAGCSPFLASQHRAAPRRPMLPTPAAPRFSSSHPRCLFFCSPSPFLPPTILCTIDILTACVLPAVLCKVELLKFCNSSRCK